MKKFIYPNYLENFDSDEGPEEPELCFDSCADCYFRTSTIKRITQSIKKLRGEI